MDHDPDLRLHDLLRSYHLPAPPADRRIAAADTARRRRWQRTAGLVGGSALVAVVGLLLVGARPTDDPALTVGPAAGGSERQIEVPGVADAVRMSNTLVPVAGAEAFGAVPLGAGAVTGATQTTLEDGTVVVLLAVTPDAGTTTVEVTAEGGGPSVREAVDGPSLLVLELPAREPHLVLTVTASGADGAHTARLSPFSQDPLACHTSPLSVGADGPAEPTYIGHLDAYLAAPLLPACDG